MTDQPSYGQPGQPGPQWQQPAPGGPPQAPALGQGPSYAGPPAHAGDGPWGPLASWGTRVAAMLVDTLLQLIGMVPYIVGFVLIVAGSPDSSSYETVARPSPGETNTGLIITGVVLSLIHI